MAGGVLDADTARRRLTARLANIPVDGCLGLRVDELSPSGTRLRLPYPLGAGGEAGAAVAVSVLADAACGCAMGQAQSRGISGPTIELRVDHAQVPAPGARWLFGQARLRHLGGGAGYLTAELTDDTGRSVALAQGHFLSLAPDAPPDEPLPVAEGAEYSAGALLAALTGQDVEPGVWRVPAVPELSNPRHQVHGGVLMAIGELAQRRRQLVDVTDGSALRLMSVTAEYLRPAPIDGRPLTCRSEYVRRGRRYRTLRTELTRPDGRVATVVTGLWSVLD